MAMISVVFSCFLLWFDRPNLRPRAVPPGPVTLLLCVVPTVVACGLT